MDRNRNVLYIVLGVLLVGAIIGTLVVVLTGDEAAADEVFLEPAGSDGTDPFTRNIDDVTAGALAGEVNGSQNGSEPGLYGGTRDDASCNRLALVRFLSDEPEKAAAWARVHDIEPDAIFEYVSSLTPVLLRGDTRVTNHGFRDGTANPIQSVLQAGTAVLVDEFGIPRVRCSCGTRSFHPSRRSHPGTWGDEWDGFDRDRVQVTFVDVDIDIFVLTDVETGDRFQRPVGSDGDDDEDVGGDPPPPTTSTTTTTTTTTSTPPTTTTTTTTTSLPDDGLGTGDVQATISWSGDNDVDIHVIDPNGEEISFANTSSSSGGQLDVDEIPSCGDQSGHVENVFWPTGSAPSGQYRVFARNPGRLRRRLAHGRHRAAHQRVGRRLHVGPLSDGQDSPQVVGSL